MSFQTHLIGVFDLFDEISQTVRRAHSKTTVDESGCEAVNTNLQLSPSLSDFKSLPVPGSSLVPTSTTCSVAHQQFCLRGVDTHPYFAVTDATGAFTIANVPAGKQTVRVWHELYAPLTQTVDVKAGATTPVEFAYTGNEKPSTSQAAFAVQELVVPVDVATLQLIAPSRQD